MAIKKDITHQRALANRGSVCWSTFSRERLGVLRIELRSGWTWLLPYTYWQYANHESSTGIERLTISFTTHSVRIEGKNLKELLLELQASNVEMLREPSERFQALAAGGVLIQSISVTEAVQNVMAAGNGDADHEDENGNGGK